MKKGRLGAFGLGFAAVFVLSLVAMVLATLLLDSGKSADFTLGRGAYAVYGFDREGESFSFTVGPGLLYLSLAGGLISAILDKIMSNYVKDLDNSDE